MSTTETDVYVAINNVLGRYAFAYDIDELDLLDECFAENAEVWFSTGVQNGRPAVLAELHRRRSGYRPREETPWHIITNLFVRPAESGAFRATSYFSFGVDRKDQPMIVGKYGRYEDVFVSEEGQWRISTRHIIPVGR
jgi:3-phenylpropionate/cinnamic acid dioxygenase small subunit